MTATAAARRCAAKSGPVRRVSASLVLRGLFRARFAGPTLFIALPLLLPGCSSPLGAERDALENGIRLWEESALEAYEFRYQLVCFCGGPGVRPVDIEVRDGSVIGVGFPDGGPPDPFPLDEYPTVDELFQTVRQSLDREPFSVRVDYDPEFGYPSDFFADFVENAVDEELGFTASGLTPADER